MLRIHHLMLRRHRLKQNQSSGIVTRTTAYILLFGCLGCTSGSALESDRQGTHVVSVLPPEQLLVYGTQGNEQELARFKRSDSKQEAYYAAGDPFLTAGFSLTDQYWSGIAQNKHLLRGHLDNYLPIVLKQLNHKPADAMMRSFANSFFGARNPQTGLIPYSSNEWNRIFEVQTGGKQPVSQVTGGVEFYQWFANDSTIRKKVVALARATMNYFDYELNGKKGGVWNFVDVSSGKPRSRVTLTQNFGETAKGLGYLSQKTGDPSFQKWADQKLTFVWQNRMNEDLPLLYDQFTPMGSLVRPEEMSSDTDTLYYVQLLFELYDITGEKKYRDWAMAVTNLWFNNAWNKQWGHFVRKLNPDGTPAVDELYGDGKYNTLVVLIQAYQVTKDRKYLVRFKQAWGNLLEMGSGGFVPERVRQGKTINEDGIDEQQTIFLDILVTAYKASNDKEILRQAEALGQRILKRGETVMRLEGGQAGNAFLQLALTRQKIQRLEVALGKVGTELTLRRNGQRVLKTKVPAEVAVVYLPQGVYEVTKSGSSQIQKVKLDSSKQVSF